MNKALQIGDIGEHICAICLLEMGVNCKIINVGATDILATVNSAFVRIQVKGSYHHTRSDAINPTPFYNFSTALGLKKEPITFKHCDIIALVALDIKRIIFSLPILKTSTRRRRKDYKSPTIEKDTWEKCLKSFNK
tara:strand:+ start:509 stop:916 length:408 start_codon:yes stop_codon:yes gene_type:complete